MAAAREDEPGVLGNLPRARPGTRSDKRGDGSKAAASPRAPAKPRASRASGSKGARATAAKPARARAGAAKASKPQRSSDPLGAAVQLAGKVAETGLRTAGELLRRLPGR